MTEAEPSSGMLRWAAETVGSETPARVVRHLVGGTHAVTHLVETTRPRRQMVLRRYPPGDTAAAREAAVLTALDGLAGSAPELIDVDPDGKRTGAPSTLITRLPGRADLTSMSPAEAAEQLGRALARVHAVPVGRFSRLRDGMAAVSAAAGDLLSAGEQVLTHYDFWSGNVLWDDQVITGIVDWSGASRAPRGFDVSWCRLDLVLLHGESAADTFLAAYERAARTTVPDIVSWDLFALANARDTIEGWHPNYADLGRGDLTATELRARHTAWSQNRLTREGSLDFSDE
ncbi:phosphotransferase family protein [Actinoplanes derwentensis]|nr:aminoglycoside phosphotransferase family protein [Actinoplanes derwentensis]